MVVILLVILYIFVVSLDLMTNSFRLIAGKATNGLFEGQILGNPVVGLMIGVVVTVVVQSSSTSTSIIVSMVAAGILKVKRAIPVIMVKLI
jgi:solute carrier family 34 (sodium-dependent phosphate cotransporter)